MSTLSDKETVEEFKAKPLADDENVLTIKSHTSSDATLRDGLVSSQIAPSFLPFTSKGFIETKDTKVPVTIFRDTGAMQTLLRKGVALGETTGRYIVLSSIFGKGAVPLCRISLTCDVYAGPAEVAVLHELPVDGVDVILGNDLAGEKVGLAPPPVLSEKPVSNPDVCKLEKSDPNLFPACAVTCSMATKRLAEESSEVDLDVSSLFANPMPVSSSTPSTGKIPVGRSALISSQRDDVSLQPLFELASSVSASSGSDTKYFIQDGVLFRSWMPPHLPKADEDWATCTQLVVPRQYRQALLELAHDHNSAGHYGIDKTSRKLMRYFHWPSLRRDVSLHVKSCHICQAAGRPTKAIPRAP